MLCSECNKIVKPVVAVDIDGTLGDFHTHFLQFASMYTGRGIPITYNGDRPFKIWFLENMPYESEDSWHDIKLAYRQGAMKRSMPVYAGAESLCSNIISAGAELWLTTTRPYLRLDNIDPDTRAWLHRHNIEYDAMLYDDDKYHQLAQLVDPKRVVAVLDDLPEQWSLAAKEFNWRVPILRRTKYNGAVICEQSVDDLIEASGFITTRINMWKERHGR